MATVVSLGILSWVTQSYGILFGLPRGDASHCPPVPGSIPYYFGTTDLMCMRYGLHRKTPIMRRNAPSRFTFNPTHRWIYYAGTYLEFGNRIGKDAAKIKFDHPNLGDVCPLKIEPQPAGFSRLSLECVIGCVENYTEKYGNYHVYTNNCHHFVNKISKVMCEAVICPQWCMRRIL
ncbi:uncharacterized protein LOC133173467 [Saccostrea echinata]|uniref:uncharacterized protein LOC133173467 n=1 Tax=Saccostrea echinata TaxID=191078 RepID=UPI002A7FF792|nr:uncharacterized protein LOC133173467 [Saccostrea echinata]